MYKNSKFKFAKLILYFLVLLLIALYFVDSKASKINYSSNKQDIIQKQEKEKLQVLTPRKDDISFGNKDAKVQIVSYDSYSCPFCGMFFTQTFPLIKEKYIDTGKVFFIHREFPADLQSFTATKLTKCFAKQNNKQQVLNLMNNIFSEQQQWALSQNFRDKLIDILEKNNFNKQKSNQCLTDKALEEKILNSILNDTKALKLNATPIFFINGNKLNGSYTFNSFEEEIEAILNQ